MKYYLLIAGDNYYPQIGSGNWIATFETMEEALAEIHSEGEVDYGPYEIRNKIYDWAIVINLLDWINEDNEYAS